MSGLLQKLFRFNGGVKPDYHKEASNGLPITPAPLPRELVIPLHQSIGGMPRPLVAAGDTVLKGQRIGAADGNLSSAVHAATSGTVTAVEMRRMAHPSGLSALCVVIAPFLTTEISWVSSETTTTIASVSSDSPMAARCLVP